MPSVAVAPPQNISTPPDFLILAVIATIVCAILNVLSLAFGVPAVIFSAMVSLQAYNDAETGRPRNQQLVAGSRSKSLDSQLCDDCKRNTGGIRMQSGSA